MKYYAVIDTNVIVSALISKKDDTATVILLDKLLNSEFTAIYSKEVMQEYREVLKRSKFHLDERKIEYVLKTIERDGRLISPSPTGETLDDMKDLPFYEIVMDKKCKDSYLVTGNIKHFPVKPFIVTAREFLDILNRNSEKNV